MAMKYALVVGGTSGLGAAIVHTLLQDPEQSVIVVGRNIERCEEKPRVQYLRTDLTQEDFTFLDKIPKLDALYITAGFGRVSPFDFLSEAELLHVIRVNFMADAAILRHCFQQIKGSERFECAVITSIAGLISSPFFAVYGAAKAGLCSLIESLNAELEYMNSPNRILNVAPGKLDGTSFYGGETEIVSLAPLAEEIISRTRSRETLFIPKFEETYKDVLSRYRKDPKKFGLESCAYKKASGRMSDRPQLTVGYLSGTFDLFHIGHLNLLRRAREHCDYLVVGVHRDASHKGKIAVVPYEERCAIISGNRYVDKVIEAPAEDSDAYESVGYKRLFVGSDYQGTERFRRYEEILQPMGVQIIYFPYTKDISSTQRREEVRLKEMI